MTSSAQTFALRSLARADALRCVALRVCAGTCAVAVVKKGKKQLLI